MNRTNTNKGRGPKMPAKYYAQIKEMSARARAWMKEHAGSDPKVQFNYPPNVGLIATITDARREGLVIADEAGKALLDELCRDFTESSVYMVQMALLNAHLAPPFVASACPECGKVLDRMDGVRHKGDEDRTMETNPGCVVLCIACGAFNTVDTRSRLCRPTAEQRAAWEADPGVKELMEITARSLAQVKALGPLDGRIRPQ